MYEETLLTQIADAYTKAVVEFNTLLTDSPTTDTSQTCGSLIQELIEMEALFPEIAMVNSPTQRIAKLMDHLGTGVFHSRFGLVNLEDLGSSRIQEQLGNLNGIVIPATPSLIDIYYVDGVLVKAHLRDGVWTDILPYCRALKIPSLWPEPEKVDIRVTISLIPNRGDFVDFNTLLWDGRVQDVLQSLYTNVTSTNYPDGLATDVFLHLMVVDTSRKIAGGLLPDTRVVQEILFNTEESVGPVKYYESGFLDFTNDQSIGKNIFTNILFFHSTGGRSVVGLDTYPENPIIKATVLTITPVFSLIGQLTNKLTVQTQQPGRTTFLPYFTETLEWVSVDAVFYRVGETFVVSDWFATDIASGRMVADKGVNLKTKCPCCEAMLVVIHRKLFCENNKCPGVVASRLASLAACVFSNRFYFNIDFCLTVTDSFNAMGQPQHLAGLLSSLRGDIIERGALKLPGLESEFDLTEYTKKNLMLLDEALEEIDYVLLEYNTDNRGYWHVMRVVLRALGFRYLKLSYIDLLLKTAMFQTRSSFLYITNTLQRVDELLHAGIEKQDAVLIATEAQKRADELKILGNHFSKR